MWECIFVALGGALGSLARFGLVLLQQTMGIAHTTLLFNVVGCFFAGLLIAFATENGFFSLLWQRFLVIGFLGGFTSFSSFAIEWWALTDTLYAAWLYPCLVIIMTLLAFMAGVSLFKWAASI